MSGYVSPSSHVPGAVSQLTSARGARAKKQLRGPKKALKAPPTTKKVRRLDGHNAGTGTGSGTSEDPCVTTNCDAAGVCTYTARVDPHAGPMGYWKFDECGDVAMPVIAMTQGVTYVFDQGDGSNWYHPLGFGYAPDAEHFAPMRPGDACFLDRMVWHQANPVTAGERWAIVIFYKAK